MHGSMAPAGFLSFVLEDVGNTDLFREDLTEE